VNEFMQDSCGGIRLKAGTIHSSIDGSEVIRKEGVPAALMCERLTYLALVAKCSSRIGRAAVGMRSFTRHLVLILCFVLLAPSTSRSQVVCKPFLSINSVREVRAFTPTLQWKWNATLNASTNHCATRSGNFEVDFVRIKENSPDLQFTQKFRWSQGQFDISMELTSDEAILDFRIGFIAPCVCREIDQLSVDYRPK
jgi:hypothetical protein